MRAVDLYPRTHVPPWRRREDPEGADFSYLRHFPVGRTAVLQPFAPEPTAEFAETLRARRMVPLPTPIPVPKPLPALAGSRFFIWKQDPSVGEVGRRLTLIPSLVVNGPRDARVDTTLPGTTPVSRSRTYGLIETMCGCSAQPAVSTRRHTRDRSPANRCPDTSVSA